MRFAEEVQISPASAGYINTGLGKYVRISIHTFVYLEKSVSVRHAHTTRAAAVSSQPVEPAVGTTLQPD